MLLWLLLPVCGLWKGQICQSLTVQQRAASCVPSLAVARRVTRHLHFRGTSKIWTWLFLNLNYLSKAQVCWSLCCFGRAEQAPEWWEKRLLSPLPGFQSRSGPHLWAEPSLDWIESLYFCRKNTAVQIRDWCCWTKYSRIDSWELISLDESVSPNGATALRFLFVVTLGSSWGSSLTSSEISPQENSLVWPNSPEKLLLRSCFCSKSISSI